MPDWSVPLDFKDYPGLTHKQSLEVHWAIQNGMPLPPYTPADILQQHQTRQGGRRRIRYKSTRRRVKTNRRRVKTHRRRHRKH